VVETRPGGGNSSGVVESRACGGISSGAVETRPGDVMILVVSWVADKLISTILPAHVEAVFVVDRLATSSPKVNSVNVL
jgi:hypothetical protein